MFGDFFPILPIFRFDLDGEFTEGELRRAVPRRPGPETPDRYVLLRLVVMPPTLRWWLRPIVYRLDALIATDLVLRILHWLGQKLRAVLLAIVRLALLMETSTSRPSSPWPDPSPGSEAAVRSDGGRDNLYAPLC